MLILSGSRTGQMPLLLAALLLISGCTEKPVPGPAASGGSATQPGADSPVTPELTVPPDNPEAVAALLALGVRLTQDAAGQVTAADGFEANLQDEHLPLFLQLSRLATLSLENGKITDAGMETVAQLPQLKSLKLQKCSQLTAAGFKHLSGLPELERLYILYTYADDEAMTTVGQLTKLRVLDLRGTKVTNAGLVHLEPLKNLIDLKFRGSAISDDGMEHVGQLRQLRVLSLEDCAIRSPGISRLAGLTELRTLNLLRTFVKDADLVALAGLTKLESLNLRDSAINGPGLEHLIAAKETLRDLDLSELRIDSQGIRPLVHFTNLRSLGLWNGSFDDEGFAQLEVLTKLQELDLEGCTSLTDAAMNTVAKLTDIRKLKLKGTNIGDDGLAHLASCKQLRELNLEQTQVSRDGIDKLQAALPDCVITN